MDPFAFGSVDGRSRCNILLGFQASVPKVYTQKGVVGVDTAWDEHTLIGWEREDAVTVDVHVDANWIELREELVWHSSARSSGSGEVRWNAQR